MFPESTFRFITGKKILIFLAAVFIFTVFIKFFIQFHGNRSLYLLFFQIFLIAVIVFLLITTKIAGIVQLSISIFLFISLTELYFRVFHKNRSMMSRYFEKVASDYGNDWEKMKLYSNLCDIRKVHSNPDLKYYDYFIFSPYPSISCGEEITDFFSARKVPSSLPYSESDCIIWLFGGSTMQNIETTDSLSIANRIAIFLRKKGIKPTVINFGTITYQSSLECIKFIDILRRVGAEEFPDIVVFYNGFNDGMWAWEFGAGNMQKDLSAKLKMIVEEDYPRQFLYSANSILRKYMKTWEYFLGTRIESVLFPGIFVGDTAAENLNKAVSIYMSNSKIEKAICNSYGIKPLFILQPAIFTKNPLTSVETELLSEINPGSGWMVFFKKFYEKIRVEMKNERDFNDLSGVLNKHEKSDFWDYVHTSPFTSLILGDSIGSEIYSKFLHGGEKNSVK